MPGSDMYVAWTNSTGGVTLSHRIGGDDTAPKLQPNPDFTLLPLQVPVPVQFQNIIKIAFSFKRSLAPSGGSTQSIAASGTTNYLYGIGSSPPNGNPDSPSSSFGIHTSFGVFAADLTFPVANGGTFQSTGSGSTSTPPTLTNIDKLTINLIHGVIMFLAWGVGPYVGIFIARFLKDALGVWWFRLHLGIMLVVTGFGTIIALILEYLYSNGPHFQNSAHKVIL